MPSRFLFRQVYYKDIARFLSDGRVYAKNHPDGQDCHQTSYQDIVARRGSSEFAMPCGGVVNDYVPFYFSPVTAFTLTIHKGNVRLRSPDGDVLGVAKQADRAFLVATADRVLASGLQVYFSNIALNSLDAEVVLANDPDQLEDVVDWTLFDEPPRTAQVPEIGYAGVCGYFNNRDTPARYQNRSRKRMAEFLVHDALPVELLDCIIVQNAAVAREVTTMAAAHGFAIPVLTKPGCFFQ